MRLALLVTVLPVAARGQSAPTLGAPALAPYQARMLDSAAIAADLRVLRLALETVHAGYDRYTPRAVLDSGFARLARRSAVPMTDVALYREVALLLAQIRCNHTKAEFPAALTAYRTAAATHLPVRVRVFGTRMFVATSSDRAVERGAELLRINGIRADSVIRRLAPFAAVDGYTDAVRASLLESDSDLMGADLDHYWPVEFGFPTSWQLEVRDLRSKGSRTVTLRPLSYSAWQSLAETPAPRGLRDGTTLSALNDSTALLRVTTFVNYRSPINADALFDSLFSEVAAQGARYLVVDLRTNGGGSDDAAAALLRHLIAAPVQTVQAVRRRTINVDTALRRAFTTWGDATSIFAPDSSAFERLRDGWWSERGSVVTLTPSRNAFRGRVSVLIGPKNGSATTMLLAQLQVARAAEGGDPLARIRLVGSATGGSAEGPTAGQVLFLTLPNSGVIVRVPLKRTDVNTASFVPGLGVFPDLDAVETVADFRADTDRALLAAVRTPWRSPALVVQPLVGQWEGVLEYRDYRNDRRVQLPTWVHWSPMAGEVAGTWRERTVYDDGPGKTLTSETVVQVVGDLWMEGEGDMVDTLRITAQQAIADGTALELRGRGRDNGELVELRYVLTVTAHRFTRRKEFRRSGASAWEFRHEYRFTRGR